MSRAHSKSCTWIRNGRCNCKSEHDGQELYDRAVKVVKETNRFGNHHLRTILKISHGAATRLVDKMERHGILKRVGPNRGRLVVSESGG